MTVTIRDVAREAGVSTATVSHALTGYPEISPKTKQKVLETARRLGYQPNINGRNLASKKSNRIALIIPDLLKREKRDCTTFRMIQGVYSYCSSYNLEVAVYAHDPEKMTYSQFCQSHTVEGILISDMDTEDPRLNELMEIPIPFVAMNTECLAPEQEELPLQEEDLLDWACEETEDPIARDEQQAYRKMKEYLSHYGTGRHTAVLCFSDYMAFGVKKAIQEAGYRIPEDFSLTGFGDSIIGEYMEPALTTVEWDPLDCGYAAAKLLHGRMNQKEVAGRNVIPYLIVARDSVMNRNR